MRPLLGQRLMVIIAHPDDEGFLFAGTMWKNHRSGGTTSLICATLGEKGTSHLAKPLTATQLKKVRKGELLAAAKFVGGPKIKIVNLPDGKVADHEQKFYAAAKQWLKKNRPTTIISFGPDGWTGHRDHMTCWRVANQLSKEFRLPLFVATVPPRYQKQAAAWMIAGRVNPHYHRMPPYRRATTSVPLPPGLKRKILSHYPSQVKPTKVYSKLPAAARRMFLAAEYFAQIR